jgi:hypothetical protein
MNRYVGNLPPISSRSTPLPPPCPRASYSTGRYLPEEQCWVTNRAAPALGHVQHSWLDTRPYRLVQHNGSEGISRAVQGNDTHGHATGDELLKEVSTGIQGLLGGRHFAARLGGGRNWPLAISWLLKLNLMVSADCEPTSASRIPRSSESSTADCHHSDLNGFCSACTIGLNVYGTKRLLIGNLPSRRTIRSSKKPACVDVGLRGGRR